MHVGNAQGCIAVGALSLVAVERVGQPANGLAAFPCLHNCQLTSGGGSQGLIGTSGVNRLEDNGELERITRKTSGTFSGVDKGN